MRELLSMGKEQYKRYFRTILISTIIYGIIMFYKDQLVNHINQVIFMESNLLDNISAQQLGEILPSITNAKEIVMAIFVTRPITYGMYKLFLNVVTGENVSVRNLLYGFKIYVRAVLTQLLIFLYTFLWSLLLIVPGIIAGLSYTLTPYIVIDNENITIPDAMKLSKWYMVGHKLKIFLFILVLLVIFVKNYYYLLIIFALLGSASTFSSGSKEAWIVDLLKKKHKKYNDDV